MPTMMSELACRICGRGLKTGVEILYRANPKGETPAVWECKRPDCRVTK